MTEPHPNFERDVRGHLFQGHDGEDYIVSGWVLNDGPLITPVIRGRGGERTVSFRAIGRTFHHQAARCPRCIKSGVKP